MARGPAVDRHRREPSNGIEHGISVSFNGSKIYDLQTNKPDREMAI